MFPFLKPFIFISDTAIARLAISPRCVRGVRKIVVIHVQARPNPNAVPHTGLLGMIALPTG